MIKVTVWCEFLQERNDPAVAAVYPDGIHEAIAQGLRNESDLAVTTASLNQSEQGLPHERLDATDVLIWWGHQGHDRVWNIEPNHPITQGIGDYFEIEHKELYGERFDIPKPDLLEPIPRGD